MSDRELRFIYREPDKAQSPTCAEIMLTVAGIVVFFSVILWRLL